MRVLEPISKGAFVVEYAGEVIDEKELSSRMGEAQRTGEAHFYIMELQNGLFIDARKRANFARFLNSSCDPNCETQKWFDAATGEVRPQHALHCLYTSPVCVVLCVSKFCSVRINRCSFVELSR